MKARLIAFSFRLLSVLPLPLSRAIGRCCGWLWWRSGGAGKKITLENLQRCYPDLGDGERRAMARNSMQETGRMALETPAVWYRGKEWRERKILRWEHPELFERALDSGRGIILLVPHFGNWEMAGMVASARRPTTILYREPRIPELNELLCELRNVGTSHMVPATGKGVMAVLKALRNGGMTMILPDQEPATQGGIFSPFFSVPAFSMTLVHRLQEKTGAQVLLAYALPEAGGFIMGFQDPDQQIYAAGEQESVDAMNRSIQQLVNRAPSHYQWEYKRFRKRPAGEAKFYRFN